MTELGQNRVFKVSIFRLLRPQKLTLTTRPMASTALARRMSPYGISLPNQLIDRDRSVMTGFDAVDDARTSRVARELASVG